MASMLQAALEEIASVESNLIEELLAELREEFTHVNVTEQGEAAIRVLQRKKRSIRRDLKRIQRGTSIASSRRRR